MAMRNTPFPKFRNPYICGNCGHIIYDLNELLVMKAPTIPLMGEVAHKSRPVVKCPECGIELKDIKVV